MSVEYVSSDLREPLICKSAAEIREYHVFKITKHELTTLFNYDLQSLFEVINKKKICKNLTLLKNSQGVERISE
jgi:hypothetical protein